MKQELSKALEELDERELGLLLDGFTAEKLDNKNAESVCENACRRAGIIGAEKRTGRLHIGRRAAIALAACAAILASLAVGAFALAEEAKEYNEAVAFCEEHDIDTSGMTRGEIKEVYRSFKNGALTYDTERPGEPSYTETAAEIGGNVFPAETGEPEAPIEFRPDNTKNGCCVWEQDDEHRNCISYCVDDEIVWTCVTDGDMVVLWPEILDDGMAVAGLVPGTTTQMVMKISSEGERLWSRVLDKGEISGMTGEPDGSLTVFAHVKDRENGTENSVIVSRFDPAGELVFSTETKTPDPIWIGGEVAHYGEGYLAIGHIFDYDSTCEVTRVMRVDAHGSLLGEFSYSADGVDYNLFDIAVYGDKLYISAYVRDNSVFGSLYGEETWANASVSDEEYTEMVKRAYKAVLLVCDPVTCEISTFCEAEGSFARGLSEDSDGFLCWDVESFYSAKYEPGASNWRTVGKVIMYTYRFDLDGRFVDKLDSGTVKDF